MTEEGGAKEETFGRGSKLENDAIDEGLRRVGTGRRISKQDNSRLFTPEAKAHLTIRIGSTVELLTASMDAHYIIADIQEGFRRPR